MRIIIKDVENGWPVHYDVEGYVDDGVSRDGNDFVGEWDWV